MRERRNHLPLLLLLLPPSPPPSRVLAASKWSRGDAAEGKRGIFGGIYPSLVNLLRFAIGHESTRVERVNPATQVDISNISFVKIPSIVGRGHQ